MSMWLCVCPFIDDSSLEKLSYYILNGKVTKEMNGGGTSWLILCIKGGKAGDNKRL